MPTAVSIELHKDKVVELDKSGLQLHCIIMNGLNNERVKVLSV